MRFLRVLIVLVLIAVLGNPAFTAQTTNFDHVQFTAAQQAGRPILVDIRASWCPTCAAQEPIIEQLTASPDYKDLLIFRVDFDSQKDIVRDFGARSQSTLIAFHGSRETGRSVGDTDPNSITKLLRSTAS